MFSNVMQSCDRCYSWDENSHSMYESFGNFRLIQTYLYNLLFCMLSGAFGVNFPLRRYPVTVTMVVASVCAQCIDTDCQRSGDTSGESTDHWYPPSYSWPPTPPAPTQLPRVSGIWKAAPHTIVPPSHTLDHKELLLFNQIVLCYFTAIDLPHKWFFKLFLSSVCCNALKGVWILDYVGFDQYLTH